jgi:hypothetical protein
MEARLSKSAFMWVVMTSIFLRGQGFKVSRGREVEGLPISPLQVKCTEKIK